jgi:hypothetical protein
MVSLTNSHRGRDDHCRQHKFYLTHIITFNKGDIVQFWPGSLRILKKMHLLKNSTNPFYIILSDRINYKAVIVNETRFFFSEAPLILLAYFHL